MDPRVDWAWQQVDLRLEPLGRRHTHVRAVSQRAREVGDSLFGGGSETLVLAALMHDIGYAPELATTGFHPLDGARFVRDQGYPNVAQLVAHHTGARREARLRGLHDFEAEFPFLDSLQQRALTYCDLTTGPGGETTNVGDRVAEIVSRYGAEHVVSRAVTLGLPEFLAIEAEIESLLNGSQASSRPDSQ